MRYPPRRGTGIEQGKVLKRPAHRPPRSVLLDPGLPSRAASRMARRAIPPFPASPGGGAGRAAGSAPRPEKGPAATRDPPAL